MHAIVHLDLGTGGRYSTITPRPVTTRLTNERTNELTRLRSAAVALALSPARLARGIGLPSLCRIEFRARPRRETVVLSVAAHTRKTSV